MDINLPDALAQICADTMREVEQRRHAMPLPQMQKKARERHEKRRGFGNALKETVAAGQCGLIAEIKKASPSGGLIRPDFDPASIALAYAGAGATCLSVLTDMPYFQGEAAHLKAARAAVKLPVLRKDFMLEPWQIYESCAMGADCVLLIMAALRNDQALALEQVAMDLDLDVLVEVHNRAELDRALGLHTNLIGINNRNLKTLRTDLQTTVELASFVPPDRLLITESGIRTHEDVKLVGDAGAQCLLVGESLLRQPDVGAAVHALLGTCAA
jgi:indole-3-glycerol phosphate synthase